MDLTDNVKTEKAKAIRRYNRLRSFAKLFRLAEFCLALVLLSWVSSRLPFAVKRSGECFSELIVVLISPLSIFLIGNGIVFTLLAKSGHLYGNISAADDAENELYEEFINSVPGNCVHVPEPGEIVYQDKWIVSDQNPVTTGSDDVEVVPDLLSDSKFLRRSQSENLTRESALKKASGKQLRRSETEMRRKVEESNGDAPAVSELSNEEFQRAIEEFIAKQVKFHKEEKLAIITAG